jgi:hypothetical protein
MKALLLALTVAAAAGAYLGGPGATSLLAPRKPTARRCPPPLALAGRWINGPGDKQGDGWTDDDDAALAHHISAHASTAKCGEPERILHGIDSAWVLIFNVGRHDEGVYTLQGRASCPTAYVLAFERTDDAERFAQQLSSEGFDLAKPLQWDVAQISAFCSAGEFEISLVPDGALITPPNKNEYDLEAFDRINEPDEGLFSVEKFMEEREALERIWNDD